MHSNCPSRSRAQGRPADRAVCLHDPAARVRPPIPLQPKQRRAVRRLLRRGGRSGWATVRKRGPTLASPLFTEERREFGVGHCAEARPHLGFPIRLHDDGDETRHEDHEDEHNETPEEEGAKEGVFLEQVVKINGAEQHTAETEVGGGVRVQQREVGRSGHSNAEGVTS
eukprot:2395209-Prymnesium_polylepis.4